jgi:DNA polymerase-3 subunit alpha
MRSKFIHLQIHTEYSLIDGLIRIEDLISKIKEQGSVVVAVTEQFNLFSMVKFYQAAEEEGIKPIIGADILLAGEVPHRMLLLCQNELGYRHLTELVSKSYLEGQVNGIPKIKKEWLEEKHLGLIAIASGLQSDIGEALLLENTELAGTLMAYWMRHFKDRFYVSVTRTGRAHEENYIEKVLKLCTTKGCPIVATNDVRFIDKEDYEAHEARVCIHEGRTLNDPNRLRLYNENQYLKSPEEMERLFSDLPSALENTVEIAKRCNLTLTLGKIYLPNYPIPKSLTMESYLTHEAQKGLAAKFGEKGVIPELYQERLNTELGVLNAMGYAGYFLIVADFIQWAKNNQIPVGPGRGSGAGSLVAYALGITGIDPLLYDLLFERFLNPERVSMPDFDIDFCMDGRDRVIEYVADTYGRESVSQIITYGTMAAKAVIRDVGRVLGFPYGFVDKIAKLIPHELGITLDKALEQEELLKQLYKEEEDVRTLIDLAKKLEGITRNAGKHAGGVVIAPSKLTDFSPLYCDAIEGDVVTQFDKNDVETIGLVKFDFLGLRTLTIIQNALETVNALRLQKEEPPIDINTLPLDDAKTFALLRSGNTTAVFQLESRGMKDLLKRLSPDVFEEIIALVALFRPGPLQSGMVDDFINRKHGRAKAEYLHPKLIQVLKPTYGIILYQEQVMQIAQILAGYTLGGADLLRRAMGKKKPEEMAKQRSIFTQGAIVRGVNEENASYIFDLMEKFAGYGFNKSHSAAYALITYQTAWLKAHYPAAFMAAVLSADMNNTDKVAIMVAESKELGLAVLPPNINQSQYKFTIDAANNIIYGLGAIKGVGEAAINHMLEVRVTGLFQGLFDFCARIDSKKVTKRVLEALIRSGAMDCFAEERSSLMENLQAALQAAEQFQKNNLSGQVDLFGNSLNVAEFKLEIKKNVPAWSDEIRLQGEKETLGFYLTGHPLARLEKELAHMVTKTIRDLRIDQNKRHVIAGIIIAIRTLQTKRGDKMAFVTLEDRTGRMEVAIFSDLFRECKTLLFKDNIVIVEGELSHDEYSGGIKMRCITLKDFETARANIAKYIKVTLCPEILMPDLSDRLNALFLSYRGRGCPVQLHLKRADATVAIQLGAEWVVHPAKTLIDKLKSLFGEESVEIGY